MVKYAKQYNLVLKNWQPGIGQTAEAFFPGFSFLKNYRKVSGNKRAEN